MGDLSKNFSLQEFNQKNAPLKSEEIKVDPKLVERLQILRDMVKKPIYITSGYRTSEYNKKVGGAIKSQHMEGKAADITVKGMTAKELELLAKKVGFTYTQTYFNKPHLHVDVRDNSGAVKGY